VQQQLVFVAKLMAGYLCWPLAKPQCWVAKAGSTGHQQRWQASFAHRRPMYQTNWPNWLALGLGFGGIGHKGRLSKQGLHWLKS
jgi:hypothetical protein